MTTRLEDGHDGQDDWNNRKNRKNRDDQKDWSDRNDRNDLNDGTRWDGHDGSYGPGERERERERDHGQANGNGNVNDEPGFERDDEDPLLVVLRPGADFLGPPPGRYREIRRAASRRRLLRTAAGAAATAAAAALIALPLHWAAPAQPSRPTAPLAPAPSDSPPPTSPPGPAPSDATRDPRESDVRPSPERTERQDATPSAPASGREVRPTNDAPETERWESERESLEGRDSVATPTAERGADAATGR
ncbi:hypothetical protein [Streptomyces mayonensis]|uniref:hypothetical protein n=1 Tax=Streptomyces mayonensis TaxID=2750816 RepID=UPI001C1E2D3E|nr:hypothetical protein [Streptomyces sp. A108]MBU6533910.1 hypothetical protein [Streptomyces sp. A108]